MTPKPFSGLADRVSGEGADAWLVHSLASDRARKGEDVIILSVGQEMDEVTPAPIVEAAKSSLDAGRHHYAPTEGETALREAIVAAHRDRCGQAASPDQCVVYAGAQNALFAVSMCLLETGDEVIVCEPYYTTYPATFTAGGAQLVRVTTSSAHDFEPDPAAVERAITPRTKALVLNFPNNPTGAVCSGKVMEALVDLCVAHGIWIISDEVYAELVPAGANASPGSFPQAAPLCVTVSSLSKTHRMTGWRLGWAVAPPELAARLRALSLCMCYGLPPFIQDAAISALSLPENPAATVREALDARRALVVEGLSNLPGVGVFEPPGGMFVLLDVARLGVTAQDFALGLLEAHAVSILPCDGFGRDTGHLLRISACESDERLTAACERISAYARTFG